MIKPLSLSGEDLDLLEEVITEEIEVQQILLEEHIEEDKMPSTVEEFLQLTTSCTERIARLKQLKERLKEAHA